MNFKMIHQNFNVFDLDKSIEFYNKALGLKEDRRINARRFFHHCIFKE